MEVSAFYNIYLKYSLLGLILDVESLFRLNRNVLLVECVRYAAFFIKAVSAKPSYTSFLCAGKQKHCSDLGTDFYLRPFLLWL